LPSLDIAISIYIPHQKWPRKYNIMRLSTTKKIRDNRAISKSHCSGNADKFPFISLGLGLGVVCSYIIVVDDKEYQKMLCLLFGLNPLVCSLGRRNKQDILQGTKSHCQLIIYIFHGR
jgi:hypothetical protein